MLLVLLSRTVGWSRREKWKGLREKRISDYEFDEGTRSAEVVDIISTEALSRADRVASTNARPAVLSTAELEEVGDVWGGRQSKLALLVPYLEAQILPCFFKIASDKEGMTFVLCA